MFKVGIISIKRIFKSLVFKIVCDVMCCYVRIWFSYGVFCDFFWIG